MCLKNKISFMKKKRLAKKMKKQGCPNFEIISSTGGDGDLVFAAWLGAYLSSDDSSSSDSGGHSSDSGHSHSCGSHGCGGGCS